MHLDSGINLHLGINSTTCIYLRTKFQAFIKMSLMFPLSLISVHFKLNNGHESKFTTFRITSASQMNPLLFSPGCVVKVACRVLKNSKLECGISVTLYVVSGRRLLSLAELELGGRVIL